MNPAVEKVLKTPPVGEEDHNIVMSEKIRLGISSCLMGNNVRYNGGHQLDKFITRTLGNYVEFVPVCPEVECGLGVPRETLRLVGSADNPRLITSRSKIDHTEKMQKWAAQKIQELEKEDLQGFIFKSKSPSSGMERVKIYHADKSGLTGSGPGIFAKMFMNHFPLLPVEEDGRLHDIFLRENFVERIFVYKRWRDLVGKKITRGALVEFHTDHKLLIMAHSIAHYRTLGRIVAQAKQYKPAHLIANYESTLMKALRLKTTVKKNTNVLQHIMGYFKKVLTKDEKKSFLSLLRLIYTNTILL